VNQGDAQVLRGGSCVHRVFNTTYAAHATQHAVARHE
jgi:hypothetical protein